MLRLVDHPSWVDYSDELASCLGKRERVGVQLPAFGQRLVARVHASVPEAVHVFIPTGPDQVEHVLLALGTSLGRDAAELVDHHLRSAPDDIDEVLQGLRERLLDRPLIVEGWDSLGTAGMDRELGLALQPRSDAIRRWFNGQTGLFVGRRRLPRSLTGRSTPPEPPVELVNGEVRQRSDLWATLGHDASLYASGLAAQALGEEAEDEFCSPDDLRERVHDLLPPSVARLLKVAALHARPVTTALLQRFQISSDALDLGQNLGLWALIGGQLIVEAGWTEHLQRTVSLDARARLHVAIANAFLENARPDDPSASTAGLSVLEAHRHFVAAGEYESAKHCWRHGASVFIAAAREASVAKKYDVAASLYGSVVDAVDTGRIMLPKRLSAYARHYLHFNRGHGKLEPWASTERGYRMALQDWPENALFWSRLVRVMCFQEKLGAAEADLHRAQAEVRQHPYKQTFLVARTVRGLVLKGRLMEAVRIWGSYEPDTPYAREVGSQLAHALREGWHVPRLVIDPDKPLMFHRPVEVRINESAQKWSAEFPSLSIIASGRSPAKALQALVNTTRQDIVKLVRAYTSHLSPRERLRKRVLLGAVDILASRLHAAPLKSYCYFGTLDRDNEGNVWLRTGGDRDLRFEVPEAMVDVVDDLPHLAQVSTDEHGVPVGPVQELKPGFRGSDEDLWDNLKKLCLDGG